MFYRRGNQHEANYVSEETRRRSHDSAFPSTFELHHENAIRINNVPMSTSSGLFSAPKARGWDRRDYDSPEFENYRSSFFNPNPSLEPSGLRPVTRVERDIMEAREASTGIEARQEEQNLELDTFRQGVVTHLHSNKFGLINGSIFFQTSVIDHNASPSAGARVGDSVMYSSERVEQAFPFSLNATKVIVLAARKNPDPEANGIGSQMGRGEMLATSSFSYERRMRNDLNEASMRRVDTNDDQYRTRYRIQQSPEANNYMQDCYPANQEFQGRIQAQYQQEEEVEEASLPQSQSPRPEIQIGVQNPDLVCRNCFLKGHPARYCTNPKNKEAAKVYMNQHPEEKRKQNERRRRNLERNRMMRRTRDQHIRETNPY